MFGSKEDSYETDRWQSGSGNGQRKVACRDGKHMKKIDFESTPGSKLKVKKIKGVNQMFSFNMLELMMVLTVVLVVFDHAFIG